MLFPGMTTVCGNRTDPIRILNQHSPVWTVKAVCPRQPVRGRRLCRNRSRDSGFPSYFHWLVGAIATRGSDATGFTRPPSALLVYCRYGLTRETSGDGEVSSICPFPRLRCLIAIIMTTPQHDKGGHGHRGTPELHCEDGGAMCVSFRVGG
jgi:hypothetical protein